MNLAATLDEIRKLDVSERLWLAMAIWETIDEEQVPADLTDGQKADLDRRMADMRANPDRMLTLDELTTRVRDRQ